MRTEPIGMAVAVLFLLASGQACAGTVGELAEIQAQAILTEAKVRLATEQRQLERDLPGPPPLPPPSGQGILLLHLTAPEEGRTSIFPRSAPMRRKKSNFLWRPYNPSNLLFISCI